MRLTQSYYGGDPQELDCTVFPTFRQVIQAYHSMVEVKGGKYSCCSEKLAHQLIDIWSSLHPDICLKSFMAICVKVKRLLKVVRNIHGKRHPLGRLLNLEGKLDSIFDLSACKCDLPEVPCSHPCIQCKNEMCEAIHIICVCDGTKKVSSESYGYLKLQRKLGLLQKRNQEAMCSPKKLLESVGSVQQKNFKHKAKSQSSRFIQALLRTGIAPYIAVSLGDTLLRDLHDSNCIDNPQASILDEKEISRKVLEMAKNSPYLYNSESFFQKQLSKEDLVQSESSHPIIIVAEPDFDAKDFSTDLAPKAVEVTPTKSRSVKVHDTDNMIFHVKRRVNNNSKILRVVQACRKIERHEPFNPQQK